MRFRLIAICRARRWDLISGSPSVFLFSSCDFLLGHPGLLAVAPHHHEKVRRRQHDPGDHGELDQRGDPAGGGLHDAGDRQPAGGQQHRDQSLHDAVQHQAHDGGLQQRLHAAPDRLGAEAALEAVEQVELFEVGSELLEVHAALQRRSRRAPRSNTAISIGPMIPAMAAEPVLQRLAAALAGIRFGDDRRGW